MTDQEIVAVARVILDKVCVSDAHAIDIARAAIPSIRERVLEEAARCVEGYPSPLDDLNMAVAVRGIANAVRNLKEQG